MTVGSGLAMYSDVGNISMEEMVERHAPLVKRIAHHILARMPSSVQVDDLIQSGLVGLLEAASNYDGIRIRGAMIDDVRRGDWAPRSVHRNARRVSDAIRTIEARTGRDALDVEVADELGVDMDQYHAMLKDSSSSKLFSYDEMVSGEDRADECVAGGELNPFDNIQNDAFRGHLADAISQLPERERLVLALYYKEELNLKEIGLVIGVSESRVSQIHSQAAMRLKARLQDWQSDEE
jgi:RNA polymerase sigma factor for flagellar operon FliA